MKIKTKSAPQMINEVQFLRFICSLMFDVIVRLSVVNEYDVYKNGRTQIASILSKDILLQFLWPN